MDYDLYTTDDRRYARVIQPDDGESLSGSSYAGSDASNAPEHSPADVVKARKILSSSQPSAEVEATVTGESESRIHETEPDFGISLAPPMVHDLLVPIRNGPPSPSSGLSHEDQLDQEDQISEVRRHTSSSIVMEEEGSLQGSIQAGDLRRQGQEDVTDVMNEVSEPSGHSPVTGTLSQERGIHSVPGNGIYSKLGSAMDLPDNGNGVSERIVPSRDIGRG